MKNIIIIINDIDPNIYLADLSTAPYNFIIIYQKPVSPAMINKFSLCQAHYSEFQWLEVPDKSDLIVKAQQVALDNTIDMIIAYAEDLILPVEQLKAQLGLKNQHQQIKNITNKYYQRLQVSQSAPHLCGQCYLLNDDNLETIRQTFKFPGIIKPISMAGSRMVKKVEDLTAFESLYVKLKNQSFFNTEFLIETYFEGTEWYGVQNDKFDDYVSVESLVSESNITHLTVSAKPFIAKPFRETGLVAPSPLKAQSQKLLFDAAEAVIKALNFTHGATHIELKLTKEGPKLIEFNPRLGGPVPYLIQTASSYPIMAQVVEAYLGHSIQPFTGFNRIAAFFSFQTQNNQCLEIVHINKQLPSFQNDNVKEGFIFKSKGDKIDPYSGTAAMLGFAYVVGDSVEACFNLREQLVKEMSLVILVMDS